MLACRDVNRSDGSGDRGVPHNIVRAGWFLDPPGITLRQRPHMRDCFVYSPALISIQHQFARRADLLAHDPRTTQIVSEAGADLEFDMLPTLRNRLAAELAQFFIAIAQPAG